ncbi:flagellar hook capping FlgD N-terminal domain-containing protein [Ketogulonicigenium vulgare]|uniref:Basal-body rod modification protein FlgD n=1 Tax=Ketogulonicigenium vulgare (strain WSH-001) TaxID=759362 RepID=F9Y4E7_KETVW|nr:flagellar hook capping FlgD N-terminal domain-containing protein [Ketogulonicigenium vulgare]ADO43480.1 flagellar hook capping protein, putative [Ketogulonicigenium vulgare Y25]AEM41760.1 Flagellar hook capping protein, putative [Ketogulonicigenium vulgare WSH-001]ALJ81868.1 flagellar basal body rod modification protein [Ketogulonicigenium vulgare]ANW34518.1 flagellar basal body rod modification protein [Ketogulonicigenium vulgare]AOZ55516.1 flagellar hook capping protein [Ketogulonicigeniu
MVTTTGVTPTTTANTATTSTQAALSSDFETFLKMLVAQVQNQDPLNPIDSNEYAAQLATFSGVEQQVQTNQLLNQLIAQTGIGNLGAMSGWIGKDVRVAAAASYEGAPVTLSPNPAALADRAEVVVKSSDGTEVHRFAIPVSAESVSWDGTTADGGTALEGLYTFEVASYVGDTLILQEQAEVYTTVREVQSASGAQYLIVSGGVAVSPSAVTALRG